jgi:hypothetical protein
LITVTPGPVPVRVATVVHVVPLVEALM